MRRWILAGLGLTACNVGVDEGMSGLSAGMSAGMSGPTSSATTNSPTPTAETEAPEDSTGGTADSMDATGPDAGSTTSTSAASSTDGPDTMTGSAGSSGDTPGDPLDPGLDVPEGGQPCTTPGSLVECPGIEVCRFHTTEQGLCESCDVCGNLGAPCVQGTDCDILFACYQGQCTNFCMLGSFECGPPEDCLEIGHPTHGVCAPF